jgi:hypothetical protein
VNQGHLEGQQAGQAKDAALERITSQVRMELSHILDPRHDRDPDTVLAEVRQICNVMVMAVNAMVQVQLEIANNSLDTNAAAMGYSRPAAQEDPQDAAHQDTQDSGPSTPASPKDRKRTRSQIPL